jgi:hypothetical protein
MLKNLIKLFAYSNFPKTTFAVRHPGDATRMVKMRRNIKHTMRSQRTAGIGAALIAIPVGYVIGRLGRSASTQKWRAAGKAEGVWRGPAAPTRSRDSRSGNGRLTNGAMPLVRHRRLSAQVKSRTKAA